MAFDANDLSPHEHFVVDRTRDGEIADFSPMAGPGGARPVVRAGFLRKLLLGLDPNWPVRTPGVRIKGVRIEGALDLTDCTGAGGAGLPALTLIECDIAETIDVSHARLARLALRDCKLRRLVGIECAIDGEFSLAGASAALAAPGLEMLIANLRGARIHGDFIASGAKFARAENGEGDVLVLQGAEIAGDVLFDEGFEAFGGVTLAGARIGGRFNADGAQFMNRADDASGRALVASGAQIGGGVSLREKLKAEGQVDFSGARIGGDVELSGGLFRNDGGVALNFTNAEVAGQMLGGGKVAGQFVLQGARIARNLDMRGVEIGHSVNGRIEKTARAFDATSISVGGAALLNGANIKGETLFADARIEGYLAFGGGRFINGGHWAIRAPNARVGGNLTFKIAENGYAPLGQKTVIEGGAKFDRAQIDGAVGWASLELRGPGPDGAKGAVLSFADATIRGPLQAKALVMQQDGRVDLSGASCAALEDDLKTGWGAEATTLDLDGFAYGRLDASAKDERAPARLKWLKREHRFSPQPYTQLAQVYAGAGRREDARRVLLAQHDQRTLLASAGPLTWLLSSLFGLIAGYGLSPIRVARALALYLALGVGGVLAMNASGALVTPQGRACHGAIEPALYAIDVALPVIDLGQTSRCGPGRAPRAELSQGMALGESDWRLFEGAALWNWAHSLYAIFGAIFAALALITFSGVLKPKE